MQNAKPPLKKTVENPPYWIRERVLTYATTNTTHRSKNDEWDFIEIKNVCSLKYSLGNETIDTYNKDESLSQ